MNITSKILGAIGIPQRGDIKPWADVIKPEQKISDLRIARTFVPDNIPYTEWERNGWVTAKRNYILFKRK